MIIASAGRRIDEPDAEIKRFPAENAQAVQSKIREFLSESEASALVCAAACGSDILALEVAGDLGLRRLIVLPYDIKTFKKTSVLDRPGNWGERYDRVIAEVKGKGDLVLFAYDKNEEETYYLTNRDILDQAAKLANEVGHDVEALIVWNGESRGDDDVTWHFKLEAERRGYKTAEIITL